MAINSKVKKLYDALKADGGDVGTPEEFNSWFFKPGKEGYHNRKSVYDTFKADGADVGKNYEEFGQWLGLHAVNQKQPQQKQTSTPMTAADRARFTLGAQAVRMDAGKYSAGNANRYNDLKQRNKKQQSDFGRVTIGADRTPFANEDNVVKDDALGTYVTSDNEETTNLGEAQQRQAVLDEYGKQWSEAVKTGAVPSALDEIDPTLTPTDVELRQADRQADYIASLFRPYIDEAEKKSDNPFYNMSRGGIGALTHNAATGNGLLTDEKARQLMAAANQNAQRRRLLELEKDTQNGSTWNNHSFWRGFSDALNDVNFWTAGVNNMLDAGALLATKQDLDRGKRTTVGDVLMQAHIDNADAQSKYGDNTSWVYDGGMITANMVPFIAQIASAGWSEAASQGIGKLVQGAASNIGKGTMTKAAGIVGTTAAKNIGKMTGLTTKAFGKALQYGIVGASQANTMGISNIAADVMGRYTGQVYQDEKGNYKFGTFDNEGNLVHEGGEDFLTSLVKGELAQTTEFATELAGGGIDAVGKYLAKGGKKLLEKFGMQNVTKYIGALFDNRVTRAVDRTLGKVEVNSIIGESMEEELGIIANTIFTGDNQLSDLWSGKQQAQIWGGMFLSIGLMKATVAPFHAYNAAQYYRYKHKVDVADANLGQLLGEDKWNELRDRIGSTANEDMTGVILDVLRDANLGQNKGQVLDYIKNLLTMRGYNIGTMLNAQNAVSNNGQDIPATDMAQNQSYQQGHNAEGADTHTIQLEHNEYATALAGELGISEEQLHNMSDDELEAMTGQNDKLDKAIYDYQMASARYQGVMDNANDKVDMAARQAAMQVDQQTDVTRGTVRNATIKGMKGEEDYGVYIISGNVATHDDGTIDISGSDKMILYYDPKTGRKEYADASRFASLDEELPADEYKAQAVNEAKEKAIREVAGIIDGKVDVGSQFTVTDEQGNQHTYEILADNGDGTAMITIDGNVPTQLVDGETVQIPMSFDDLQQLKDAEDERTMEAARQQRAEQEAQREQQKAEVEQKQDQDENHLRAQYNNLLNDEGKVVMGTVHDGKHDDLQAFIVGVNQSNKKPYVIFLNEDGTFTKPKSFNADQVEIGESVDFETFKAMMPEVGEDEETTDVVENSGDTAADTELGDTLPPLPDNTSSETAAQETEQASITLADGTVVPIKEDGNLDTSQLTAQQVAELYETQFGEDAESIISSWVSESKKALDKANNMTVKGSNFVEQKASKEAKDKAIADAQEKYDSAKAIADAYQERQMAKEEDSPEGRKTIIEKARRKFNRMKSGLSQGAVAKLYNDVVGSVLHRLYDSTGIDVLDDTPMTAEEYVASNLGAFSLNYEGTETAKGVKQETGMSRADFAKTRLLASDGKGMTMDAMVHSLWEHRPEHLQNLDDQDIRKALIDVITSGFNAKEAKEYVQNLRIAQAESILEEQKRAAEDAAYAEEQRKIAEEEAKNAEENTPSETSTEETTEGTDEPGTKQEQNEEGNLEVTDDATADKPLGEQLSDDELPFSAKDDAEAETPEQRAANVERNRVDNIKTVDNIVGEKTRKALERIAKMMGAKIQWQYTDSVGNGWYDADTNTLYLTLDSSITEGVQFIFGHEMTHEIKMANPAAYDELRELVIDMMGEDVFNAQTAATQQKYNDAGVMYSEGLPAYEEEVVADQIGYWLRDLNYVHTLALKMSHPLLAKIHEIINRIRMAFHGTEYTDTAKMIMRSIEQAYVQTANGTFVDSATGENTRYSLRQKPEPTKKGIGYKVFVLKNGKLYPPKVANPNGAETPVGVWLDADAAPVAGETKTGRPQVKQGGKGTEGGSGKLAYRPGWHLGLIPYALQFNRKDAEGKMTLFPANFVFAEVEYAADKDYQDEAHAEGVNANGKYQHSLAGLKHLPTDGYYMYRTNPNPETDPWVITGAMKVNRILTRAEQADLVKKAGREPQKIQDGDIVTDEVVNSINQKISNNTSETSKENGEKFSLKDKEYLKAVEDGDMEKAQKMVNEAAEAAGYSTDSSYQGTSAFNGSAPWGNGYFLTKEERKEAWDNGEFEGESTLGDYINADIDGGNLEELTNAASYRAADPMRKEAIDNVRNAIQKKSKTITMYRSVPSDVKEGSFRNGDWVTPSRAYAVDNAKLHGWGDDYNIIEQKVPVDDVWFDGNDIAEWGYGREEDYVNDTDFAYKNTKNNRKLLDAVTYDDNGNVIPLSQRFNSRKADVRYSLKDDKTLVGVHNITEDKLRKALNQGGLANPSVAIVDSAKQIHEGYGGISLIMPNQMIAKRTGQNAGTFFGDAWTPSYPHVERQLGKNGDSAMREDIDKLPSGMQSLMQSAMQSYLDGRNEDGLAYMFLSETGRKPEMVKRESEYSDEEIAKVGELTNGTYDTEGLSEESKQALFDLYLQHKGKTRKEWDESVEPMKANLRETLKNTKEGSFAHNRAEMNLAQLEEYGYFPKNVNALVNGVRTAKAISGTADYYGTSDAAMKRVREDGLTKEYNNWLAEKDERYGIKEVIFDGYTPSGNRKYVPNDLKHVSQLMKKAGRNGAEGSGFSFNSFVAEALQSTGNLDKIRARKSQLTNNQADVDAFTDKWGDTYIHLASAVNPEGGDVFNDTGYARLKEMAGQRNPIAYAKKEYGVSLSEKDAKQFNDLLAAIREERPTRYFETKFERPVTFNEFSAAVVPSDMDADVRKGLEATGLRLYDYDANKEGDRQRAFVEAINSGDNIRFSLAGERGAANMDKAEEVTTRLDNLSVARKMEEAKKDAKAIKLATGWERGADGKWRYEISDGKIVEHPNMVEHTDYESSTWYTTTLGEIYDASEIYRAYPELKSMQVVIQPMRVGAMGVFDGERIIMSDSLYVHEERRESIKREIEEIESTPEYKEYSEFMDRMQANDHSADYKQLLAELDRVRKRFFDSEIGKRYYTLKWGSGLTETTKGFNASARSVLAHEIQHAIQYIEGFAKGGSPEMFHDPSEQDRLFVKFDNLVREKFGNNDTETLYGILDGTTDEYRDFVQSLGDEYNQTLKALRATKKYTSEKDFRQLYDRDVKEANKPSAYTQYRSLAGEVESRNVQKRLTMTDEERRNSLVSETEDVAREDQIFLFGNGGESHMGSRTDKRMAEIGKHFEDKELNEEQRAIVDVFSGVKNRATVIFTNGGREHRMEFAQGREQKAGTKHAIFRHYENGESAFNAEDIRNIYATLERGGRNQEGNKIVYTYTHSNGAEYTVIAEKDKGKENFVTFYTNRKASDSGVSDTLRSAHANLSDASDAAKIVKDFENPSVSGENSSSEPKFSLRVDQYQHDLAQWKKDNNLPKDAERPAIPVREPNETAVDFAKRVKEYRRQMALWKTAPQYEDHLLTDDTAQGQFNLELQRGSVLARIALQDSMLAVRKAQEAIMKEVGVDRLNIAEDAYTAENRSHGKGKNEFEEYNDEFLQPLRRAYNRMMKNLGKSYDKVKIYMVAKHGLERNAHIAFKKALDEDFDKQADRIAAYNAYKADMDRINNDADFEAGRIDFTTWRQKDNAIRTKYVPSYLNYRYDKMGIAQDYSGLSALFEGSDFEEAAAEMVKDVETRFPNAADDLWQETNAATKKILRDSYKAGMMTREVYDYVRGMYQYYIPLRGWGDTNADQVWNYMGGGKGAVSQTLKKANGRKSLADDPIAYIENMAESGILLNNKNWVKQHLLLLAENHPTSLLNVSKAWYIKTIDAQGNEQWIPASPNITDNMTSQQVKNELEAFEKKMEQMKQKGDATQKREHLEISYPQTKGEEREHEVRVMRDGEEYVIYVNGDPQLAQAMNNTRAHRVREGLENSISQKLIAKLGRWMASVYTSLSPLFIPSNFSRDATMTLASTAIREDARYNYLLRKNMLTHWNTMPLVVRFQNGKLREKVHDGTATKTEQMFYDYMMNGGETGFVSALDVEDMKRKFKNELKDMNRMAVNPVKVGHIVMDSIETLNRAIEDSNRFMVYMTSIEYGRSIDEAVNDAKDVTLNFNRKGTGEHGWQSIRNLYLFINPAIQSLQTLGALAKHHPFKFTAVTTAWLASGMLVPLVNNLLMDLLGGDDDKDKYWSFSKWDRRNNFIMWVPGTHNFIKIPLAQEFRVFYGVGDMIAAQWYGSDKAKQSWKDYGMDLMGQVIDMLPLDPTGYGGNIAVSLMPNPIRPAFELAFNVDFTGKPLFKESEYNKYDPNFTKAYAGTPDWLVRISRMVNSIGNDYPDFQQNAIDKFGDPKYNLNNPAVVDHVLKSYLGGAYTMGSQILGVATKALNGDEIKMADVPLASKFVGNPDDRPVSQKQGDDFWNTKERHDQAARVLSQLKKKAKVDGDYSTLDVFYGSDQYKQYKLDDAAVKKYKEERKKEAAEEAGDEYLPKKLTADAVYQQHTNPKDDFEDMKISQMYPKVRDIKKKWESYLDTLSPEADPYYDANAVFIQTAIDVEDIRKQINEAKKEFLTDGKETYSEETMGRIRSLRKEAVEKLEKVNKVLVEAQKARAAAKKK